MSVRNDKAITIYYNTRTTSVTPIAAISLRYKSIFPGLEKEDAVKRVPFGVFYVGASKTRNFKCFHSTSDVWLGDVLILMAKYLVFLS